MRFLTYLFSLFLLLTLPSYSADIYMNFSDGPVSRDVNHAFSGVKPSQDQDTKTYHASHAQPIYTSKFKDKSPRQDRTPYLRLGQLTVLNEGANTYCMGVLYTDYHFLTASDCITDKTTGDLVSLGRISISTDTGSYAVQSIKLGPEAYYVGNKSQKPVIFSSSKWSSLTLKDAPSGANGLVRIDAPLPFQILPLNILLGAVDGKTRHLTVYYGGYSKGSKNKAIPFKEKIVKIKNDKLPLLLGEFSTPSSFKGGPVWTYYKDKPVIIGLLGGETNGSPLVSKEKSHLLPLYTHK